MKSFNIILEIKDISNILQGFVYDTSKESWIIESNIASLTIEEHWDEINNKLDLLSEKIRSNINTTITIITYDKPEKMPPIFIPPNMLKFAGETKSNIKIINNDMTLI